MDWILSLQTSGKRPLVLYFTYWVYLNKTKKNFRELLSSLLNVGYALILRFLKGESQVKWGYCVTYNNLSIQVFLQHVTEVLGFPCHLKSLLPNLGWSCQTVKMISKTLEQLHHKSQLVFTVHLLPDWAQTLVCFVF